MSQSWPCQRVYPVGDHSYCTPAMRICGTRGLSAHLCSWGRSGDGGLWHDINIFRFSRKRDPRMSCLSLVCRCTFAVYISYRLYAFPHRQILPGSQTVPASGGLHRRAHLRPPVRVPRRAGQGASSSWCVLIQQSRPGVCVLCSVVSYIVMSISSFVALTHFCVLYAAFFSASFLQFHGVPRLFPPPRASAAPSLTDPCGW